MKFLSITGVSLFLLFMKYPRNSHTPDEIDKDALLKVFQKKKFTTISCSPDWATYYLSKDEIQQMIPLPGIGAHKWKISTKQDSAQFYFNQGINLYYGFHIVEALPSFKKAQLFDSTCAMLYWGEALAYGPNINDYGYTATPEALAAARRAHSLTTTATLKEKGLIEAIEMHYSDDSTMQRKALNEAYANQMKGLYAKYPTDAEIGTLYVDALMNLHPWDLWLHNGKPEPWTPQIESLLEGILKYAPDHPGANHYYIHTMEASPFAEKAIASADKLGRLAPGMSHMVHMPSHIYIRTGQYDKGINVNKAAVARYDSYLKLYPDVANNAPLYEIHNRHMQAACSMNKSDYASALKDALDCRSSFDTSLMSMEAPSGNYIQYVYMTPELTMITFKRWSDILNQPLIDSRLHYAALIQQFARGMALANTRELGMAKSTVNEIENLLTEEDISVPLTPFSAPVTSGTVAKYILLGTIAEIENNLAAASNCYRIAVFTEDTIVYNEPRDWLVHARQYYGNLLLKIKRNKDAEKVFREDLKIQPKNFISEVGLKNALH
ncbi:MAG: hypothetical protein ABI683_07345 [Ginsengibacter sp.]